MVSAPTSPFTELAKDVTKLVVLLGDTLTDPDLTDEIDYLEVITVEHFEGGGRLNRAVLRYHLAKRGEQLVDIQSQLDWNRVIEIRVADEAGGPLGGALFWGHTVAQSLRIDETGEYALIDALITPNLFGDPLTGMQVREPIGDVFLEIQEDIVFNPEIDGIVEGNQSDREDKDYRYWIDPESVRTSEAETVQEATAEKWPLREAVHTLLEIANGAEDNIENPEEERSNPAYLTAPDLKNVTIPRGLYLPAVLDQLLHPHGYGWYVAFGLDESDATTRTIRVFKKGEGDEREVFLQRPGAELDLAYSNLPEFELDANIYELANVVWVYGSLPEREITIELFRGWPEADDDAHLPEDLERGNKASNEGILRWPNVWRLWVGNEAGDYCDTRSFVAAIPSIPRDLSSVFSSYVPRRRVIGDMLKLDEKGRRLNAIIEYYDPDKSKWIEVPAKWGARILEDQIGVYFAGDKVPGELMGYGDEARLRITGTIIGDERIVGIATDIGASPNSNPVTLYVDASDRFHDRQIVGSGPLKSDVSIPSANEDTANDQAALDAYAQKIQDTEKSAVITATLPLHGLHFDYSIGDIITKIDGREISFNRNSPEHSDKRYLQVSGIRWHVPQQTTELIVEPF